jgi:Icc protein
VTRLRQTFVQLSDLHHDAQAPLFGRVATLDRLRAALALVDAMDRRPDAIVLTGDVADRAAPEEYRAVRALLDPAVRALGVPLVVVPGNHDARAPLREHLLGEPPASGPLDAAVRVGDARVVALDTSVEGEEHGELTDAQLAWLRAELAEPAPAGTVLALHHPPLPSPVGLVSDSGLREPGRLAAAIAGTDVRMILAGHAHHAGCGALGGVPVWGAPSLVYATDVGAPREVFRGLRGGTGVTRVDVFDDAVVATFMPLDGRETLLEVDFRSAEHADIIER